MPWCWWALNVTTDSARSLSRSRHLVYDDSGTASDGPPVVFLHGFACNRQMWVHQAGALERSRRVIAIDLPGHGETRVPLDPALHTEEAVADLVLETMREVDAYPAVLVGFSMGGGVALNLAARHPEAVAGLLLADVGGGSADPLAHSATMARYADMVTRDGLGSLVDHLITTPIFCDYANRDDESYAHMRGIMMTTDPEEVVLLLDGVLSRRQPVQDRPLGQLRVPTSVLVGGLDKQCEASSAELASRIAGAELTVLDGVGHMTPVEDPERFNASLQYLLQRVGP